LKNDNIGPLVIMYISYILCGVQNGQNGQTTMDLPTSLKFTQQTNIAILTLSRPEKRNALNDETILGIERVFRSLPEGIRAVVLHGAGDHFSAGLDLSELSERNITEGIAHSRMWHRALESVQFASVPVVAALHGAVVGGGLELAAACHVRVAERPTYYGLPEGSRGIFVGGGGSVRIPRLIGVAAMMEMMLTGRTYSADEGHALRLSHYVVENGTALGKAMELGSRISKNTTTTNYAILHVLPRIAEADPASGYMMEALTAAIAQGDPEAKSRLQDFLEKRGPKVLRGE
jgi:enoyl-CoA hydratase/carnithine racemase